MNERHRAFVEEYLVNGYNATQAYIKTYPDSSEEVARSSGSRLLTNANIQSYIASKRQETAERNQITKEEILAVVSSIMNKDGARESDRLKATEILLKALGYNEIKTTNVNISSGNLKDLLGFNDTDEEDNSK